MTSDVMVSIIVPMYNCTSFIRQCLDSVANQSWRNIEAILVDDCSTDNTVEVVRRLVDSDRRFTLICAAENGGPGHARNLGIAAARGDFLIFLDADDWLNPDAVATLLHAQSSSQADIVVSAFDKIQTAPQQTITISHFPEYQNLTKPSISQYALQYMREPGKFMMFSYCWGRLFKASTIKKYKLEFRPNLRICEDVLFNFEYLRWSHKLVYINVSTYNYRFGSPNSAAMAFILKDEKPLYFYLDIWQAYCGILAFVEEFGPDSELSDAQQITRLGHISHSIVLLIRACGNSQGKLLYELVRSMVHHPIVKENLKFYFPLAGQSRMLPLFMRLKLVLPLILLCKYKYRKRYRPKLKKT